MLNKANVATKTQKLSVSINEIKYVIKEAIAKNKPKNNPGVENSIIKNNTARTSHISIVKCSPPVNHNHKLIILMFLHTLNKG